MFCFCRCFRRTVCARYVTILNIYHGKYFEMQSVHGVLFLVFYLLIRFNSPFLKVLVVRCMVSKVLRNCVRLTAPNGSDAIV